MIIGSTLKMADKSSLRKAILNLKHFYPHLLFMYLVFLFHKHFTVSVFLSKSKHLIYKGSSLSR